MTTKYHSYLVVRTYSCRRLIPPSHFPRSGRVAVLLLDLLRGVQRRVFGMYKGFQPGDPEWKVLVPEDTLTLPGTNMEVDLSGKWSSFRGHSPLPC